MATVDRSPLIQEAHKQPDHLRGDRVWSPNNLVTTTLFVAVASLLPQGAGHSQFTAPQHPSHVNGRLNLDTSQGTGIQFRPDTQFAPTNLTENVGALRRPPLLVVDNSTQDTNIALLTSVATPKPIFVAPHIYPPRYPWLPANTSIGIAKNQFVDPNKPSGIQWINSAPPYTHIVVNTSVGTAKSLYADPNKPSGFQWTNSSPPIIRSVVDTSQGVPLTILTLGVQPSPKIPYLQFNPQRFPWLPADTSQEIAKVLYADPNQPIGSRQDRSAPPYAHTVVNTSQSSSEALLTNVPAPFIPAPNFSPQRYPSLPADTSQRTPKVLYADSVFPIQNLQQTAPDKIRPVTDTSLGTPATLFPAPPESPPVGQATPQSSPQRYWFQPQDSSIGTAKTLYADSILPIQNLPPFVPPLYVISQPINYNVPVNTALLFPFVPPPVSPTRITWG